MYYLNLDKKTNRILSASLLFNGTSMPGSVEVETLPDGNLYDYLYVNGEFVYSPENNYDNEIALTNDNDNAVVAKDEQSDIKQRVSNLESSITKLTELVNQFVEQNK